METVSGVQRVTAERFLEVRKTTEKICQPLYAEDFVVQPITDVSPPKWHLGHTSWFFETFILSRFMVNYRLFNPVYNFLFNSYYESVGERLVRSQRGNLTRPGYQEIMEYRSYINNQMKELLEQSEEDQVFRLAELGLQHEQQHQELLLTDIKYILGHNPLFPLYQAIQIDPIKFTPQAHFLDIPEGIYEIGVSDSENFYFDNEGPSHKVWINSFRIMNRLVSNGEYLEFINDSGYKDFRHWHMEGWEIVKANQWEAPLYWIKKDGEWYEYTLFGLEKLDPLKPVAHISFYEAAAYAAWKGKRLLTEAEWEVAAKFLKAEEKMANLMEFQIFHPMPPQKHSIQLLGDAWEWTYSAYHPYPGYERLPGALGEYNGKFMINQMVLRGGSCATPESHIRSTYRNFFHPDKRWQFTGIRLAENV